MAGHAHQHRPAIRARRAGGDDHAPQADRRRHRAVPAGGHVAPGPGRNRMKIPSMEEAEQILSEPTPRLIETLSKLDGDLLVLGVAGKMGPTLARMAKRC